VKLGVSTYSLHSAIRKNEMTVLDVIQWIADNGGEHVEIVPIGFNLVEQPELIDAIRGKAKEAGVDISNYAIGANFLQKDEDAYEAEIARVKSEVEVARALGVSLMRHDAASRPIAETGIEQFERDLPQIADACRSIADYASQYGIVTSVENHGYFVQASDRVQRLVKTVDRPNYKTTIDVGNFMCADENSVVAVTKNIPYASMVHLKDFYLRPADRNPGDGWFPTAGGNYLRGAIVGQGDIDMRGVISAVKHSGYDGYISIEFEGLEDCRFGTKVGLDNARRMWDEVQ